MITKFEQILAHTPGGSDSKWVDQNGFMAISRLTSIFAIRQLERRLYPLIQSFVYEADALNYQPNKMLYDSVVDQLSLIITAMNQCTDEMANSLGVRADMPGDRDYKTICLRDIQDVEESCILKDSRERISKKDRDELIHMWNELVRFFSDKKRSYITNSLRYMD